MILGLTRKVLAAATPIPPPETSRRPRGLREGVVDGLGTSLLKTLAYNRVMTKADLTRLALELPIDQRLDLAQTLWDSASPPEDFTLPELRDLLDARLLDAEDHPETSVTWEEMKARLLRRA
jgi:putative addiction module component (TIGR02574 family)